MTRLKLFRLKNTLIFANLIANLTGVSLVMFFAHGPTAETSSQIVSIRNKLNLLFLPFAFFTGMIGTMAYELPLRRHLQMRFMKEASEKDFTESLKRRLLNEPFFLNRTGLYRGCHKRDERGTDGKGPHKGDLRKICQQRGSR